jgi:hypothetical protein
MLGARASRPTSKISMMKMSTTRREEQAQVEEEEALDWSMYPSARDEEWAGYTFPTPRPGVADWSQSYGVDTNYVGTLPWVPPIHHDLFILFVNEDDELEYAPLPLTEEHELQCMLMHVKCIHDLCSLLSHIFIYLIVL